VQGSIDQWYPACTMAHKEKKDSLLGSQLDELEQRMSYLKIQYEKYFSGIERIEPLRERDDLKRMIRDMHENPLRNPAQRFKFQQLKARLQSLEMYWIRNLVMIERGTHPKMQFRANLKGAPKGPEELAASAIEPMLSEEQEEVLRRRQEIQDKEDRALKLGYEKYMEARARCGQSTDIAFDTVRGILKQQVRQIKSQFGVESVRFRIAVEEGKAKVKAVPVTPEKG
jgi:hypothetical protein